MKLKKLSIFGFKSFADKVILDFDCSIIGIVGPNGCGKSNIVDAIRWVMGEQSAKSMRGDKMHDVLFAGSDNRKPLGYAEVALTFTDIEDDLPVPYSELTIARRLHRNGESEYFINKEPARLRDIQGLFLGSGIGKNAFSIFEQGKLDQIIHLSPLDRRAIFDEAAGTSRFLLRKKETLRKLEAVNDNYSRARDVHAEIEKQVKQLKRQATHAKSFQENKNRLEELEKNLKIQGWQEINRKADDLETKKTQSLQHLEEALHNIRLAEERLAVSKQNLLEEEILVKQQQKESSLCETKWRVLEAEVAGQKHHLLAYKKREEMLRLGLQELSEQQQSREEEIQKKQMGDFTEEAFKKLRVSVKARREEHLHLLQENAKLNAELKERTFRYEAKISHLHALDAREQESESALKNGQARMATQKTKVADLSKGIDSLKADFEKIENELGQLRKQQAQTQKEDHTLARQINELEGQQKALKKLQDSMEGFSTGAKELLKEAKNAKSPLYGKIVPLVDYFHPHKGYETLTACAMRNFADTLVVESEQDFEEIVEFATRKKISAFSLVVKSRIPKPGAVPKETLATHLEKNAVAIHFSKDIEITATGHFYDALGVFFQMGKSSQPPQIFSRQAELKSLGETLIGLREKAESIQSGMQILADSIRDCEKKRSEIAEIRRKKEMDLVQENFNLQRAITDLEKIKQERAKALKEKEALSHLDEEKKSLSELQSRHVACAADIDQLLNTLKLDESKLEKWQTLNHEIEILRAKHQQSAAHEKKMQTEIEELRVSIETILKNLSHQEKEAEALGQKSQVLSSLSKEKEKILNDVKKEYEKQERELSQSRKMLASLEKEHHGIEVILAQDIATRDALLEELAQKYSLRVDEIENWTVSLPDNQEEVLKEIRLLKSSLDSAGAVNMTAIEEFKQTQERFDYLDQQLKDLEVSKKDLETVIATLDQESRKIFKSTFQQIRENFQKNFSILFNGGSADLTFTESSDILEAGVEIVAKPPGKQMRSISLLSGGEKCLTALALLFSIFEVKPAPFCVLDEVDAPLDDRNIDRFTEVLKKFIDETQFIIVTHNKKTMSIADLLIGVSMEEKGVSKLISLAFEKRAQPALK